MDDRAEFEKIKRESAAGMAADEGLRSQALEVITGSDRHHWSYQWSWLGVPIIQLPPDVMAAQEVVWETRPQIIIETGIARGGSIIFFASMLELIGAGEVIGIDIDIRPHNRDSIESHPLSKRIHMIEGSSIDPDVVGAVKERIPAGARVMVVLDSNHTHDHVLEELHLYSPLVTVGQFLIVADTIVEALPVQDHRPRPWGPGNNPATALKAFLGECGDFIPDDFINAKLLMTSSPGGFLRRVKD